MAVFLPCLLERWSSPLRSDEPARVYNTWSDVRRDVLRNLDWLLNTERPSGFRRPSAQAWAELPPAVQRSVLCFGIDPYSGQVQSQLSVDDVAWSIRERIIAYESRLEAATLEVRPIREGQGGFNRLRFAIQGYLRADPMPLEFLAHSEIDMESGTARVSS